MGKAYAHKSGNRKGDLFHTPKSLVWVAEDIIISEFCVSPILEPCAGDLSLSEELEKMDIYTIHTNDLYSNNCDINDNYLDSNFNYFDQVITNPPFSLWDEFVLKAKSHCKKFMFIGRLDYLTTLKRFNTGIWKNLKSVYPFNRRVDYRTPYREDGHFHVGTMPTGWFLWDMSFNGNPQLIVDKDKGGLNVQPYATLGNYKE